MAIRVVIGVEDLTDEDVAARASELLAVYGPGINDRSSGPSAQWLAVQRFMVAAALVRSDASALAVDQVADAYADVDGEAQAAELRGVAEAIRELAERERAFISGLQVERGAEVVRTTAYLKDAQGRITGKREVELRP